MTFKIKKYKRKRILDDLQILQYYRVRSMNEHYQKAPFQK